MNEVSAVTNKVHERVVKQGIVPKKIVGIEFGVPTEEAMRRMSHLQIFNRELYMSSNTTTTDDLQTHAPTPSPHQQQQQPSSNNDPTKPYPHGVLDGRMGLSSKKGTCETCGLSLQDCIGHFGYVKLELPVFHVGYMKNIVEVLQRICKSCGRILLLDNDCQSYLRRFRLPHLETLQKKALYKQIGEKCKKVTQCPHCQSIQGTIRKVQALKIVHEKYKSKNKDAAQAVDEFMSEFDQAISYNKDLKPYLNRAQEDLSPLKVLKILKRVSDVDVELLDMDPQVTRPEQLILTHMLVPPLCIRPSVASDNGTNEDDLTSCMSRIIHTNSMIRQSIKKGEPVESLMELWDYLSNECAVFINSEQPGLGNNIGKPVKPIRSLCQRLKGKYGRFRGNLSGKRVDFSGRTVISPDPNLELWQVAVPELVAKVLTFPECVNKYNKKKLQKLILNGPDVHPGANFVEFKHDGTKKFLKFAKRDEIAANLQIGDIVERHVMDNDIALFNRQPSLHRLSIMSHRVKVLPYRTFRFNVCDCAPFNADFDGDEMNLHIPQTQEARAEAINLMGVLWNLCTPKNGCPVIACNQDFLTAGYKMSRRDMFFDRSQFCMLMSYMGIEESIKIDLPPPTIWKPIELWTGKQLFSLLIKPNRQTHVHVNLETKAKNYEKDLFMDPNDGYVYFYNSQLLCGNLDKKTLGDGSKSSLFYMLMRNYGPEYAAKCMARVARVTSRWLMNYGFSIGIDDVTPSERLTEKKMVLLDDGYNFCENKIAEWRTGKLEAQPGCTTEQTLEAVLNKELSEIRNKAGNMCLGELHPLNAPLTMAVCGSKGSTINISQMIACVGQQTVGGSRIQNGFMNRTLPHFPLGSRSASAKGFVANSFYTGLTPTEFFFHTMAGREGLVDTAVKTAETGYMQRRLMKALEDLAVQYDYTVRNSSGGLIQFKYGDDKLDPIHMEDDAGRPLSLQYALDHVKHIVNMEKEEKMLASNNNNNNNETDLEYYMKYNIGLEPDEIMKRVKDFLLEKKSQRLFSKQFAKEYTGFFRDCADKLRKLKTELSEKNDTVWNDVIEKVEDIKITEAQLTAFFDWTYKKYLKAVTEPGQTVGAIAGQSIGEPGTQMTLKTFHFAGVASMNVTLGVPRIVEIINATRNISTPIITAELDIAKNLTAQEEKLLSLMMKNSNNNKGGSQINKIQFRNSQGEKAARIVKGRIEKATLGEVCEYIKEVYDMGICYIDIKLDRHIIGALQLNINNATVVNSIQYAPKLGIKDKFIRITDDCIRVYPLKSEREHMYHSMQYLKSVLPGVIVSGIPSIGRAVINKKKTKEDGRVKLNLLVEGSDLLSVMGTQGVKGRKTTTNNILELEEILGIEAARGTIINEIYFIMSSYGMNVDVRHMKLLADVMSFKGEILGITRYGIGKMRDSVLMLASFERTTDHLFDAAVHSRRDAVEGVSECIIMGMPIGNGTGIFKLLQKVNVQPKEQPKPIFAL